MPFLPYWNYRRFGPSDQPNRYRNYLVDNALRVPEYLARGAAMSALRGGYRKAKSYFYPSVSAPKSGRYSGPPRKVRRKMLRKEKKAFTKKQKKYMKKVVENNTSDQSTNTWRDLNSGQLSCLVNSCNYGYISLLTRTQIEAAIDGAKVLDPNSGTLASATVDLTTIDGVKTKILGAKARLTWRNNAQTPVNLKCYWMSMKKRTASNPDSLFERGLEQMGITSNETSDLRFDIYDSPEIRDYFNVYKTKKYQLNAGDEVVVDLQKMRSFEYDPDEFDVHSASEYNPGQTQVMMFRIEGVPSHDDTTTNNVGTCDGTLDYIVKYHIKFASSLGVGAKYKQLIVGSGALDAQAAGARVAGSTVEEIAKAL